MSYFSPKETLTLQQREDYLLLRLQASLQRAKANSDYYRETLKDIDPASINSRQALAALPLTRKADLIALQSQQLPFGGLNGMDAGQVARLFQSPGPIHEPEGKADDWWRMGQAFYAAGFREGDIVHNTLSYHLSPGGFIMDSGARACGCAVIPAGTGQTELQLQVIQTLQPNGYCGTPSFLKLLIEKAEQNQQPLPFTKALVSGEPLPDELRQLFTDHGIQCRQAYATADVGLIAYEQNPLEGLIVAEDIILELVRPGTGEPVTPGDVGEIVVTVFNEEYPLARFATGDLTAALPVPSSCGRTNTLIKGWLGRADQSTKVKGLFIHPKQVDDIVRRHPEIIRAQLVVDINDGRDTMTLLCHSEGELDLGTIEKSLKSVSRMKGQVRQIPVEEFADTHLVIVDNR
ncbi:phenylacetate--CoA ligase family protein [Parendozoicomonas haliclonae]|uniref:Phenylacetate-coenzyme A ligase n=1 Tax=Parendozoicomonas haliclonae TaxID=1960125 RepID=A0A1X7AK93_9GAMM|nr:AMP-binding protein [Parendozoicomonas haliclonae]SMA46954.1 Phenylacetate-coenzyme A ligase [Parendozoicomonas haliclonae]